MAFKLGSIQFGKKQIETKKKDTLKFPPSAPGYVVTTTAPPGTGGRGTVMTTITPEKPISTFDFNKFIQEGGTKISPTAGIPPDILPKKPPVSKGGGGGGTYYPDSGTLITPEGVGVSTKDIPPGAIISKTPNPQLAQRYVPPKTTVSAGGGEAQKKEGFSGVVNIYNKEGKVIGEQYFVRGVKTGEIMYAVKRGTTTVGKTGVVKSIPSTLTFKTPTEEKIITFTKEGAEFQTTTFLPGEVQIPNYEIPSYELSTGTYTEGGKGYSRSLGNVSSGVQLKGKTAVIGYTGEKLSTYYPSSSNLFKSIKTSETYSELFSKIIPQSVKNIISKDIQKFNLGITRVAGVVGIKTLPTLSKIYTTSPFTSKEAQFLILSSGFVPKAIGLQKFIVTEPLREVRKPYAVETITSEINMGKLTRYSDYAIFTEQAPPRIQYTTSLYRESIGKIPKDIIYLPSIVSKTKTPFLATAERPFITLETVGGKVGKLTEVSGTSTPLDILSYKTLPKSQQFLIQRLAESKTGGIPVAEKNLFKILSPKDLRFISDIDIKRLGKFKIKKEYNILEPVLPRKLGMKEPKYLTGFGEPYFSTPQKMTRFQTITETKLLEVPKGMEDVYELSKSKIVFKDVTKPLSRARGKTPELNVYTKEFLEPKVISKEPIKFISPANIKKTSLTKKFQIQRQLQLTLVKPSLPLLKVSKAITKTDIISSPVQESKSISLFAGTGVYERTEGGQVPSMMGQTSIIKNVYISRETLISEPQYKTISKTIYKVIQKPITKEITKTIQKPILKEITKVIPKEITKTIQKPMQKLTSKLIQKQITKPTSKIIPSTFLRITPSSNKQKLPLPSFSSGKQPKPSQGIFSVFMRRFGKFKPIGRTRTQKEAFQLGMFKTGTTLGATFKIEKFGGGAVDFGTPFGYYKKPNKKGILFIEKRGYRLSTPTELKEIQMFKNLNKKGSLF